MAFKGFPRETVAFLAALAKNNNRPWFQANKHRYEQFVRGPAPFRRLAAAPRGRPSS